MTSVAPSTVSSSPVFLPGAELALAGLSLATAAGFWRVFDRAAFLPPLFAVVIVSHLVMVLGRRRGWGVPLTAGASATAAALAIVWLVFPDATTNGLPTGETAAAVVDALQDSYRQFGNILAPAVPEPGFIVASAVALYFAVFLADWAAFRLWSSFEAVVPTTTLFLFCALLGANHRVLSASIFLGALLLFLLLHRIARQESSSGWLTGEPARRDPTDAASGRSGPVLIGAALVATAVLAGTLLGTHLPGAGSQSLIPWRNTDQPGERKEMSPLVRIRDRLLRQSDEHLFTVQANRPAYWRLTALDDFDGDIWKSQEKFTDAEGDLPGDIGESDADSLEQRFTITGLDKIWAPAAFQPVKVLEHKVGLSYSPESSTLIVDQGNALEGSSYVVQSKLPHPSADILRSVPNDEIPRSVKEKYTALPEDFSERATRTALAVTQGKERPFDMALALQDFFRSGDFRYDTNLEGHDENAIDQFLQTKLGFCEQFAGTYAAMARSLGLPARVAVGFTQGIPLTPNASNVYEVTGRQAHAWPEVYLGRFGWMMFEPTPSRGAPNAPWTGVTAQQDEGPQGAPATTAPGGTIPGTAPGLVVAPPTPPEVETTTTTFVPPPVDKIIETRRPLLMTWLFAFLTVAATVTVILAGLAGAVMLYIAVLASIRDRRRRERRRWATDSRRSVLVAWEECLSELRTLGLMPFSAESHDEFARRIAPRLGDAGPDVVFLAEATDNADYARDQLPDDVAAQAMRAAESVVRTVDLLRTPAQVWASRIDPRPLLDDGRQHPHHTISVQS